MESRWKKVAGPLALVLCLLVIARTVVQLARAPETNWDMLPAMALALEWEVRDPVELHRRTYAAAHAELPAETFAELTASGVRRARAEDPAAFHEHLAFYRARVLYSLAVYALHRLGAGLASATSLVSVASFAGLALLFFAWARRHLTLARSALFALGLAHVPAFLNLAGTSSADGLATLLVCLAAYLWLERGRAGLAAGVLTLSLGARPDGIVAIGCLAVASLVLAPQDTRRARFRVLGAWVGASALVYLALTRYAGEYGWWPLIQISFLEKSLHPATLATSVDWHTYGTILARQLGELPGEGYVTTPGAEVTGSTLFVFFAALAALGLAHALRARASEWRIAALLTALLAAYLVRFLLFPQVWDRFFAPFYALVPLCGLALLAPGLRARVEPVESP